MIMMTTIILMTMMNCDDNNDEQKDRDDNDDKTLVHLGCRRDECRALNLDANSCSPQTH